MQGGSSQETVFPWRAVKQHSFEHEEQARPGAEEGPVTPDSNCQVLPRSDVCQLTARGSFPHPNLGEEWLLMSSEVPAQTLPEARTTHSPAATPCFVFLLTPSGLWTGDPPFISTYPCSLRRTPLV